MLDGGAGNDMLFGRSADVLYGVDGNDAFILGAGAGLQVYGGAGDDWFDVSSTTGNDTIDGGVGTNVVKFEGRAWGDADLQETLPGSGIYTLTFTDGQTIQVSNVQDLVFTDIERKLP